MASPQPNNRLFIGLNRGHVITKRELPLCPSSRNGKVDPDKLEFANEGFMRGQKHLLKNIYRRKPSHAHNQAQQPQPQNASISVCVEVGKFRLDEEIERLKRDKNVLMQESVRLRQQQQVADNQLQTLGKRLEGMERHQQMTMSFLAKSMQSPGLFAQLV